MFWDVISSKSVAWGSGISALLAGGSWLLGSVSEVKELGSMAATIGVSGTIAITACVVAVKIISRNQEASEKREIRREQEAEKRETAFRKDVASLADKYDTLQAEYRTTLIDMNTKTLVALDRATDATNELVIITRENHTATMAMLKNAGCSIPKKEGG